jgi:hypothetical protein
MLDTFLKKQNFMLKRLAALLIYTLLALRPLLAPDAAYASEVRGPEVRVHENNIYVGTGLDIDQNHLSDIAKGVTKEIIFYVDLFRVWKMWPDEFVLGKTFTRTLKCDPVKKEYTATSLEGSRLIEKRFRDCNSLLQWALTIEEVRLTNITELEPSRYFVKVSVESRLRKLPPFINLLFFFVKEKEFSIKKESAFFPLNMER